MDRSSLPYFWELLSSSDQEMYIKISNALGAPTLKNKRNTRINDFADALEAIEIYQNHEPAEKWKRCLVSGLVKFDGGIVVNIKQFKKLVRKCKTSINTSLKDLGYSIVSGKACDCEELLNAIPCLRGNTAELRQWTVRYRAESSSDEQTSDQYVTPPSVAFDEKCSDYGAEISMGSIKYHNPPKQVIGENLKVADDTAEPVQDIFGDYIFDEFIHWDDSKFGDFHFANQTF
jgi:hypothetical protein